MAKPITDPLDIAIASATAAGFLILANNARDEVKKEQKVMRDYLGLQSETQDYHMSIESNVLHPRRVKAVEWALALEVPTPDPEETYDNLYYKSREVFDSAKDAYAKLTGSECYSCQSDSCDNEFLLTSSVASANASYAENRQDRARMQKRLTMKSQALQGGLRYANGPVGNIYSHLDNSIKIQGGLLNQATGIAEGSMGAFGYSVGHLTDTFSRFETVNQRIDNATVRTANQNVEYFNKTGRAKGGK